MAYTDRGKFKKAIAQIIAAAWDDPVFMNAVVNAGDAVQMNAALATKGIQLPPVPGAGQNTAIKFLANTETTRYMVIPLKPKFSDVDIGLVALVRQQQIFECCCDQSFVDDVKDMVGEAAEAERQDAEGEEE